MTDDWMMRIGILVAGLLLMGAMWYFGTRPRNGQGRRVASTDDREQRLEPTLGAQLEQDLGEAGVPRAEGDTDAVQAEMDLLDQTVGAVSPNSELGKRNTDDFDKIITLYIAARAGQVLRGPDIVVAAEDPLSPLAGHAVRLRAAPAP